MHVAIWSREATNQGVGLIPALPMAEAKMTLPNIAPVLLVVASGAELKELQAELAARRDFKLRGAATTGAAVELLESTGIDLVLVGAEAPHSWVDEITAAVGRLRPGTPVLAMRNRHAEEPSGWLAKGVGVLRRPLVPDALTRTIDVVLGMKKDLRRP